MLNKKGWGLIEMLVLMGILALFLLIAIYYIYNMYNDMGNNQDYYHDLENNLKTNAQTYLDNYYEGTLTSENIIITSDLMKNYGLGVSLIDPVGRDCQGYVTVNKSKAVRNINAYISCPSYTTPGYEEVNQ